MWWSTAVGWSQKPVLPAQPIPLRTCQARLGRVNHRHDCMERATHSEALDHLSLQIECYPYPADGYLEIDHPPSRRGAMSHSRRPWSLGKKSTSPCQRTAAKLRPRPVLTGIRHCHITTRRPAHHRVAWQLPTTGHGDELGITVAGSCGGTARRRPGRQEGRRFAQRAV